MRKNLFLLGISFLLTLNVCSQSIMTVNDLLQIRTAVLKNAKGDMTLVNILQKRGYVKTYKVSDDDWYFYKDCRLVITDSFGAKLRGIEIEAIPQDSKASFLNLIADGYGGGYASLTVYGKANAKKWFNQIKALGYRSNSSGGKGNQGQSWEYSKRGYPDLCIWNDYGDTYVLSLNF